MQEKCLIYIEKILKVADSFLNLVKFLLNPPILFLVDKRGCKIAQHCGTKLFRKENGKPFNAYYTFPNLFFFIVIWENITLFFIRINLSL